MNHPASHPQAPIRLLTELDHTRLAGLLRRNAVPVDCVEPLEDLLFSADLVPVESVPATVATMRSRLLVIDSAGERQTLTLCYPDGADVATGKISVLSAMGLGLLGRSVGQVTQWQAPNGHAMKATLQSIVYQPEAEGDFQA